MIRALAVSAVALAASACASQHALAPASGAPALAGSPGATGRTVAGVEVQVDGRAWRWGEVEGVLAPVRVTLTNRGDRPLLVRYQQFGLRSPWGYRLSALPPYDAAGQPQVRAAPGRGNPRFLLAPWSPREYGVSPAAGPLPDDPMAVEERQVDGPAIPPNEEVVRRALPEGILEPGGTISGFLFFPDEPRGTALTFVASLVDAGSGRITGTAALPLAVE